MRRSVPPPIVAIGGKPRVRWLGRHGFGPIQRLVTRGREHGGIDSGPAVILRPAVLLHAGMGREADSQLLGRNEAIAGRRFDPKLVALNSHVIGARWTKEMLAAKDP